MLLALLALLALLVFANFIFSALLCIDTGVHVSGIANDRDPKAVKMRTFWR